MENLVGRKLIAIDECEMNFDGKKALVIGKEYEVKHYRNDDLIVIESEVIKNHEFTISNLNKFFKSIDEPKFKQGDKVLVKNHGNEYKEREFIGITSEGKYLCWYEDKTNALPFVHIKPYEEQIKVGDWVHNSDGHVLKCKYLGLNNNPNWIKITNPQLIELLNNEL